MPVPDHSLFTGWMPFLPPNQQRQRTEGQVCLFLLANLLETGVGDGASNDAGGSVGGGGLLSCTAATAACSCHKQTSATQWLLDTK